MTISENYRDLNRQLHAENNAFGTSGRKWAVAVEFLHARFKISSVLDYGCGKQTLSSALPALNIAGYDPAIPELSAKPASADLVVCGDVLEHIEPEYLDKVIEDLDDLSKKIAFIVVSTREAAKTLQDGRNAHLIVKPADWWVRKLESRFDILFLFENQAASELVVLMASRKSKVMSVLNKARWIFGDRSYAYLFSTCAEVYRK
ncbi:MAG: methyltransferase domain-containing protein [bacterium]|jgi:hypothetical protein